METGNAAKFEDAIPTKIAAALGVKTDELLREALESLLKEKKRLALRERLEILSRYGVSTLSELEEGIARGLIPEHPAWEDLIVIENLSSNLKDIDAYLGNLQEHQGHCAQ
jgi:hypothetical protein